MNYKEELELYSKAIEKWGSDSQILMVVEEMNELSLKLLHSLRALKRVSVEEIAEEVVDVEIMLKQLKFILNDNLYIDSVKEKKLIRLKELIEK